MHLIHSPRWGRSTIVGFSVGISCGFLFSWVWNSSYSYDKQTIVQTKLASWSPEGFSIPQVKLVNNGSNNKNDVNQTTIRILCWVFTYPENHKTAAVAVRDTWGRRCDKLLFMSSEEDQGLPSVALPIKSDSYRQLWTKTRESLRYIYQHHLDEADWFLKTDDDTYVIVENLRNMLKDKDPLSPVHFGCRLKREIQNGYFSGGAGYVLSKEAVKRFAEKALPQPSICPADSFAEDVRISQCLEHVGVERGDSRDENGKHRFLPFPPEDLIPPNGLRTMFSLLNVFKQLWFYFMSLSAMPDPSPDKYYWYPSQLYYPQKNGSECCSDTHITFHYVKPLQMYVYDFFLYNLKHEVISAFEKPSPLASV